MENLISRINSIPVMLDDIRKYDDFDMSRCTYFTIESDAPSPNWVLGPQSLNIPFYLLGLSGIIWKPLGDHHIFDSPESIDGLFDAIEDRSELYIDVNDIWLPNYLFDDLPHERGNVYRIEEKLFVESYLYRHDRVSLEQFLKSCEELRKSIAFSEIETKAFKKWEMNQIEQARDVVYPKKSESELKWHE